MNVICLTIMLLLREFKSAKTDGHFPPHSHDASTEDYARVHSPDNSNIKTSGCTEQLPNAMTSKVTDLVLKEQSQVEESLCRN